MILAMLGNYAMKHLLSILLTITICFTFSGCGDSDHSSQTGSVTDSSSQVDSDIDIQDKDMSDENSDSESDPVDTDTTEQASDTPTTPPSETDQISEYSSFSIHYIDVGQADAALVECDGHYMLIDGGNKTDSSQIYTVLRNTAVPKLDIVVGTHAHEDHIGGLPGAFSYTTADITLCPTTYYDSDAFNDFKRYADSYGGGITIPSAGDTYSLGSASVIILGVNDGSDVNNTSIVLKVIYGNTAFLFTGDAEREVEQAILNRGYDLSASVLKVGHHGSDTSTTYPFLREIMPEYAVISVGKGNSYGHPTDNNLSRLRDADVTVYRTDLNGDVYVTSDGQSVTISSDKSAGYDEIMTPGGKASTAQSSGTSQNTQGSTTAPSGTDYVVNINTRKFHYPRCSSVNKMKESNKLYYTGTRDDLISQGYDPCGNCHP